MWEDVLTHNLEYIKYADTSDKELMRKLISMYPSSIGHLKDQPYELCKIVAKKGIIHPIRDQTTYLCKISLKENPHSLSCIRNQTEELCRIAIEKDLGTFKLIKNKTPRLCKIAFNKDKKLILDMTRYELDKILPYLEWND